MEGKGGLRNLGYSSFTISNYDDVRASPMLNFRRLLYS